MWARDGDFSGATSVLLPRLCSLVYIDMIDTDWRAALMAFRACVRKRCDRRFRPMADGRWWNELERRSLAAPTPHRILASGVGELLQSTGLASLLGQPLNPVSQAVAGVPAALNAGPSSGVVGSSATVEPALLVGFQATSPLGILTQPVVADAGGGSRVVADSSYTPTFYVVSTYSPSQLGDQANAFISGANPQNVFQQESGTTNATASNSGPIVGNQASGSETATVKPTFPAFDGTYNASTGAISGAGINNVGVTMGHTGIDSITYDFPTPTVVNGTDALALSQSTSLNSDWDPTDDPPIEMLIANSGGGDLSGSVTVVFSWSASTPVAPMGSGFVVTAGFSVGNTSYLFYNNGGNVVYAAESVNGQSVGTTKLANGQGFSTTIALPTNEKSVAATIGWESEFLSGPSGTFNGSGTDKQLATAKFNLGMTIGN
jgi:hypothetical protein